MKKKILSIILATAMTMSLAACGSEPEVNEHTEMVTEESTTETSNVKEEEPVGYVKEVEEEVIEVSDEALNRAINAAQNYSKFLDDFYHTQCVNWKDTGYNGSYISYSMFTICDAVNYDENVNNEKASNIDNEKLNQNNYNSNLIYLAEDAINTMSLVALNDYLTDNIPENGLTSDKYQSIFFNTQEEFESVLTTKPYIYAHKYFTLKSDEECNAIISKKVTSQDIYYNLLGFCRVMTTANFDNFVNAELKTKELDTNVSDNYKIIKGWNDEDMEIAFSLPMIFTISDAEDSPSYELTLYFDKKGNLITCDRNDEALWNYALTPADDSQVEELEMRAEKLDTMWYEETSNCEFIPDKEK